MSPVAGRVLWVLGPRARPETLNQARRLLTALHEAGTDGCLWIARGAPPLEGLEVDIECGSGWLALARAARQFAVLHALDRSAHGLVRWAGLLQRRRVVTSFLADDPPPRPPIGWGGLRLILPYALAGWPPNTPVIGDVVPHHTPNVNRVRDWLDAQGLRTPIYLGWSGSVGVREALEVAANLQSSGLAASWLLLGWRAAPAALVAGAGLRWIDRRHEPLASDFYWALNALLVTDSSWAARLAVLEAFQHRVPVVGRTGLLPDLLTAARAYVTDDVPAALIEILREPERSGPRREAAFSWVQAHHRPEIVARQYQAVYGQNA